MARKRKYSHTPVYLVEGEDEEQTKTPVRVSFNLSLPFQEDEQWYGESEMLRECIGSTAVLDCETTGLFWWQDSVVGVGVYCPERNVKKFIRVYKPYHLALLQGELMALTADPHTTVVFHNAKFDCHFLGVDLWWSRWRLKDTMVMAHLYDSRLSKGLANLEKTFLGTQTKKQLHGQGPNVLHLSMGALAEYCLNDCRVTYELYCHLLPLLTELGLLSLFEQEMVYVGLLQRVERHGLVVDREFIARALHLFRANLIEMEQDLFRKTGRGVFQWRSNAELSGVLYDYMGVAKPVSPFGDGTDKRSLARGGSAYNKYTTAGFLLSEKAHHPLGELVAGLRETDKFAETLQMWSDLLDSRGLMHGSFNSTGTRTGRLSSSNPNLQNIASDVRARSRKMVYTGLGGDTREGEYNLRLAICSRPDYTFASIDSQQQEMRLFAILANDPKMVQALRDRLDIHKMVAEEVWGLDLARDPSILSVLRDRSKAIGFGLIYGMHASALEHRLNMSEQEAERIANDYFRHFPRVQPFLKETVNKCKRDKLLRLWNGRIWREDDEIKMFKGANALVQGGGAGLLEVAALRCMRWLDANCPSANLVSLIHDELLFELPDDRVEDVAPELARIMEVEDIFKIPFATECKVGKSYGDLHKME